MYPLFALKGSVTEKVYIAATTLSLVVSMAKYQSIIVKLFFSAADFSSSYVNNSGIISIHAATKQLKDGPAHEERVATWH